MENEELKALVLARCGEATKDSNYASSNIHDWDMEHEDGLYKIDAWKGCVSIAVDELTPSDSKVWQLAAQILHIEENTEMDLDELTPEELKAAQDNAANEVIDKILSERKKRPADTKDLMELGKSIAKTQELLMGMNEPRPSEGLLWEAFQEAKSVDYLAFGHLVAKQAKEKNREQFEKWIATLPPDPLAADKAAIQTEFANGLERKLIDAYCTGDAIAAIKRFAGMEVSNG